MESDAEWLSAVTAGHPPGGFGHREHLRLAWLVLTDTRSVADTQRIVSETVKRLATAHGAPQRFNQTVTDAWVRIVAHCQHDGAPASLEQLLEAYPWLLDKRLLLHHYSSRTLAGVQARTGWVEPDLQPIPG